MPFGGTLVDMLSPVERHADVQKQTGKLKFIPSRRVRANSGSNVRSRHVATSVVES
jgi:hypothetical protein